MVLATVYDIMMSLQKSSRVTLSYHLIDGDTEACVAYSDGATVQIRNSPTVI